MLGEGLVDTGRRRVGVNLDARDRPVHHEPGDDGAACTERVAAEDDVAARRREPADAVPHPHVLQDVLARLEHASVAGLSPGD